MPVRSLQQMEPQDLYLLRTGELSSCRHEHSLSKSDGQFTLSLTIRECPIPSEATHFPTAGVREARPGCAGRFDLGGGRPRARSRGGLCGAGSERDGGLRLGRRPPFVNRRSLDRIVRRHCGGAMLFVSGRQLCDNVVTRKRPSRCRSPTTSRCRRRSERRSRPCSGPRRACGSKR